MAGKVGHCNRVDVKEKQDIKMQKKNKSIALALCLSWLEHHPVHQKFADLIPGQSTRGRQLINVSLSH